MSIWLFATLFLIPPLVVPVAVAMRVDVNNRLAATQMAGGLVTFILALFTFASDQAAFIDLALCLALLSIAGTLLTALFMERWL